MPIAKLDSVQKAFRGGALSAAEKTDLVKEVLLLTLARASRSDTNVRSIEVSTIQKAVREATGEELSEADVRVAANSELFENQSIDKTLARLRDKLAAADRAYIARTLAEVIRSDRRVNEFEIDYFDRIAAALALKPSEIAGLVAAD